jgi:hypothetical protein
MIFTPSATKNGTEGIFIKKSMKYVSTLVSTMPYVNDYFYFYDENSIRLVKLIHNSDMIKMLRFAEQT